MNFLTDITEWHIGKKLIIYTSHNNKKCNRCIITNISDKEITMQLTTNIGRECTYTKEFLLGNYKFTLEFGIIEVW